MNLRRVGKRIAWLGIVVLVATGCQGDGNVSTALPTATTTSALTTTAAPESTTTTPTPSPSPTASSSQAPARQQLPAWDPNNVERFGEATVTILLSLAQKAGVTITLDVRDDVRLVGPEKVYTCSALKGGEEDRRLVGRDYSERPAAVWCGSSNAWEIYLLELSLRDMESKDPGSARLAILVATGDYVLQASDKPDASAPCGAGFLAERLINAGYLTAAQAQTWLSQLPSADQHFYNNGLTSGLAGC